MNISTNRFSSLDIMRGLAVVLMIEVHIATVPLLPELKLLSNIFAAPFFLIAAGVGYQLFLQSREKRKYKRQFIFWEAFCRALLLFLVTTLLFIIGAKLFPQSFQFNGILKWNIFQVISVGYIFGFFIWNNKKIKLISIIAIFTASALINYYQFESLYFLTKGFFPLIPWISYFIFGQLIYEIYKERNLTLKKNKIILAYSTIFFSVNLLLLCLLQYTFQPEGRSNFPEFLMISSIFLLLIMSTIRWVDLKPHFKTILAPLNSIGKIAFTAYYFHIFVVFLSSYYIFKALPPGLGSIIILALSISFLTILEKVWRKYEYIFGLEWILRKGTILAMTIYKRIFPSSTR